jgi:hypothetical protein
LLKSRDPVIVRLTCQLDPENNTAAHPLRNAPPQSAGLKHPRHQGFAGTGVNRRS